MSAIEGRIGFLHSGSEESIELLRDAFEKALSSCLELNQNDLKDKILYEYANEDYGDKLKSLAKYLTKQREVKVIVAAGGPVSAVEVRRANPEIKIVYTTISKPEEYEKEYNLYNATGTAGLTTELDARRLELLVELLRKNHKLSNEFGVLINPDRPLTKSGNDSLNKKAHELGVWLKYVKVKEIADLAKAREKLAELDGLVVSGDPKLNHWRWDVIAMSNELKLPAIYQWKEFADGGGLIALGTDITDAYRRAGDLAGRILKNNHVDMVPIPVPDPTSIQINKQTADMQGITIPDLLLGIKVERVPE